ncbi:MAG: anti-sigma factor family protein [Candidatus Scalinduaceae bacterium]
MKAEQHIAIDELMIYLENSTDSEENVIIEEHLAECDACVANLSSLDALKTGLRKFGEHSQELVESGASTHLTDEEIPSYVKDMCDEDKKRMIVTHLAGCEKCFNDVLAIENVLEQIESEATLIKKVSIISKFIVSHPTRIPAVEREGKELIREAARNCFAPFLLERAFSFSFKGTESTETKLYKKPRKMDIKGFTIEMTQTLTKPPKVIIGIMAKDDFKQVKVTIIYLKEGQEKEQSEMISLRQRNAVIHKENMTVDDIINIEVRGYKS